MESIRYDLFIKYSPAFPTRKAKSKLYSLIYMYTREREREILWYIFIYFWWYIIAFHFFFIFADKKKYLHISYILEWFYT